MSICVIAACRHNGQPRLVICSDTQVSTDTSSAEVELKMDRLPHGLLALYAGNVSAARELMGIYKSDIRADDVLDEDTALECLRRSPVIKKKRMIEAYVQSRLGLTYDEFLTRQDQIDRDLRSRMFNYINELNLNVEMIVAGFAQDVSVIFRLAWDSVDPYRHFACIGAGSPIADHLLHMREQQSYSDLYSTLYAVFEAKKFSESAPSVGKRDTILIVAEPMAGRGPKLVKPTPHGMAVLQAVYNDYGLRPLPSKIPLLESDGILYME
jgi:hypothetical protein